MPYGSPIRRTIRVRYISEDKHSKLYFRVFRVVRRQQNLGGIKSLLLPDPYPFVPIRG